MNIKITIDGGQVRVEIQGLPINPDGEYDLELPAAPVMKQKNLKRMAAGSQQITNASDATRGGPLPATKSTPSTSPKIEPPANPAGTCEVCGRPMPLDRRKSAKVCDQAECQAARQRQYARRHRAKKTAAPGKTISVPPLLPPQPDPTQSADAPAAVESPRTNLGEKKKRLKPKYPNRNEKGEIISKGDEVWEPKTTLPGDPSYGAAARNQTDEARKVKPPRNTVPDLRSDCHDAAVRVVGDSAGPGTYFCAACGNACDGISPED